MKRTPLKRGTKQLKRSGFKQKAPTTRKVAKKPLKRAKTASGGRPQGYVWKMPRWFKSIPLGSHGSTPVQKKLWKLTSDYVRIHDFYKHGAKCVSCSRVFESWKEGQAAHFKAWWASNSYFKYNLFNLALSCAHCNHKDDGETGHYFGKELERRHGKNIIDTLQQLDQLNRGVKMDSVKLVGMGSQLVDKFKDLEEKPDYWDKMMSHYEDKDD